jgi:uncharacterized protein (DUF302 family)
MAAGKGLISKPSRYSVLETLDRLEALLASKQIKIFARVDHSGEAHSAGLTMPPTQVLIFGNPRAGTPIMLAEPTAAIDLPLKALAWQDRNNQVWLTFSSPEYLAERFQLGGDLLKGIAGLEALIDQVIGTD